MKTLRLLRKKALLMALWVSVFPVPFVAPVLTACVTYGYDGHLSQTVLVSAQTVPSQEGRLPPFVCEVEQLYLSLEESIQMALERNLDIHLTYETLVQAEADIIVAKSLMLPHLDAEGTYTRMDEPLVYGAGPASATLMEENLYRGGVVVRQPIFAGGRLMAARKASGYLLDARKDDKMAVEMEVVFQVTRLYYTAQVAESFNKVAHEALNLLNQHAHDVAILVREGENPELDLLRTRTDVANARKNLNAASNAYDLALSALKKMLVLDLEIPLCLTEVLDRRPITMEGLSLLTDRAISRRPELSSLKAQVSAAEQNHKAAIGAYYPTLSVEGRYEYLQGETRELEGDFRWTAGLGARMPLWNWGETGAKVQKARSQLKQANLQLQKTEDQVRLEVRDAFLNLEKAEKNIEAAEAVLGAAKEAFRLARAGYRAGEGTNTDVLDARTALSRAEANHVQALFEQNVASAALQRATGKNIETWIQSESGDKIR